MMNEQAATMNKNTSSVSNNDKEEQQQQQRVKATTTSTTEEKVVKMDTATKSSIGKEEEANTQKEVISKTTSSSATSAAAAAAASFNSGKWTTEEFEYMIGLMEAFKAGQLPLQEGTTLRSFLSSMMGCKPKRISKKFEGIAYNGRLTYQKSRHPLGQQAAMMLRARLSELERRYHTAAADQREANDGISSAPTTATASSPSKKESKPPADMASVLDLGWGLPPSTSTGLESCQETAAAALTSHRQAQPGFAADLNMASALAARNNSIGHATSSFFNTAGRASPGISTMGLSNNNAALLSSFGMGGGGGNDILGSDVYRNLSSFSSQSQQQLPQGSGLSAAAAGFGSLGAPSLSAAYEARLRDMERQQSALLQLRELEQQQRQQQELLSSLSSSSGGGGLGGSSSSHPTSSLIALREQQQLRDQQQQAASFSATLGLGHHFASSLSCTTNTGRTAADLVGRSASIGGGNYHQHHHQQEVLPSVQHNMDANRFVLQAPQDDTSYFQQRLLPGVSSTTTTGGSSALAPAAGLSSHGGLHHAFARANASSPSSAAAMMRSIGGGGLTSSAAALQQQQQQQSSSHHAAMTREALSQLLKRPLTDNDMHLLDTARALKRPR